jgi:hypothetical protein
MRKPLPNREQQRAMIMDSIEYKSGTSFNKNDAAAITGLKPDCSVKELTAMCSDGVLSRRVTITKGASGRGATSYNRPPPTLLPMSWRKHTNEQLGIEVRI